MVEVTHGSMKGEKYSSINELRTAALQRLVYQVTFVHEVGRRYVLDVATGNLQRLQPQGVQ